MSTSECSDDFDPLLETTLALVFVLTPDGRIAKFNRACEITTGYTSEEVEGRPYWELLLRPGDAAAAESAFKSSNIGYFLNLRKGCWLSKTYGDRLIEWSSAAMVDDEGVVQWLVGTGIDVTEKKEAQQRALELEIQGARAQELTKFVRSISHDLRTPVAVLEMLAYLIARQNQQPKLDQDLEGMRRQTKYLMRLLNDTQLMVDLIESSAEVESREFNLGTTLCMILDSLSQDISAKQLHFQLELSSDCRAVVGDEALVLRAIRNLVENAVRFTGEHGSIEVRVVQQETSIAVEVRDTGIGIPLEDLPRIFDYFYKVDEARTARDAGCGLGLTIAKHIAQLHHGSIEVESQLGHGSTFRLVLPQRSTR